MCNCKCEGAALGNIRIFPTVRYLHGNNELPPGILSFHAFTFIKHKLDDKMGVKLGMAPMAMAISAILFCHRTWGFGRSRQTLTCMSTITNYILYFNLFSYD